MTRTLGPLGLVGIWVALSTAPSPAAPLFHVVGDYQSTADTPFPVASFGDNYVLEDFETGRYFAGGPPGQWPCEQFDCEKAIPGVYSNGGIGSSAVAILGLGSDVGHSLEGGEMGRSASARVGFDLGVDWILVGDRGFDRYNSATSSFRFDEEVLGFRPTHAGLVWTGPTEGTKLTISTKGKDNRFLGGLEVRGDGSPTFVGLANLSGIHAFTIRVEGPDIDGAYFDHFQFGAYPAVAPEPASWLLCAIGAAAFVCRRRS